MDASKQQRWSRIERGVQGSCCGVCLYCCCCLMQSKLLRGLGTRTRLPRLALQCLIIIHKLIVASCDCLKQALSTFLFFSRRARKPVKKNKKTICSSGGESMRGRSQCLSACLRSNTNRPFLPVRPQEVEREWPRVLRAH